MRNITRITVHHSAAPKSQTVEQVRAFHKDSRGWSDIGYNIIIRKAPLLPWTVELGRDIGKDPASSVGENAGTIAVCVFGDWHRDSLPREARSTLVAVLVSLCREYKLSTRKIAGHKELPGEATACPGFNMDEIRALVDAELQQPG